MNYRKWITGIIVAVVFGLLTACSGLSVGMKWQAFVAVLSTSLATHLGAYLMKHPPDDIVDDSPAEVKKP